MGQSSSSGSGRRASASSNYPGQRAAPSQPTRQSERRPPPRGTGVNPVSVKI